MRAWWGGTVMSALVEALGTGIGMVAVLWCGHGSCVYGSGAVVVVWCECVACWCGHKVL